jgi:hypothetical protein
MSQNFPIPGDKNFAMAGFFSQPASRAESDSFRQYYRQMREETCNRLIELAYDAQGNHNKWSAITHTNIHNPRLAVCTARRGGEGKDAMQCRRMYWASATY